MFDEIIEQQLRGIFVVLLFHWARNHALNSTVTLAQRHTLPLVAKFAGHHKWSFLDEYVVIYGRLK